MQFTVREGYYSRRVRARGVRVVGFVVLFGLALSCSHWVWAVYVH